MTFKESQDAAAKVYLTQLLTETGGCIKKAAGIADVHRATLHNYMHKYGLKLERKLQS